MGKTQEDAGILIGNKLSNAAKHKILNNITRSIRGEPSTSLFTCGPRINQIPGMDTVDLTDINAFDDFQKNILGTFEKIVITLNFPGQFVFAPAVYDPIALATQLGFKAPSLKFPSEFLTFSFAFPAFAPKLGISPKDLPKITAKIATLVVPQPPSLQIPNLDIKLPDFIDLFKFNAWPTKLPNLFLQLATQIPSLLTDLLSFKFDSVCSTVLESKLFGDFDPRSVMGIATAKTLTHAVGEAIVIAIVGGTMGSSPRGLVGILGRTFGYVPPS